MVTSLSFLPLFGFILYLLLGRQIQHNQYKIDKEDKKGLELIVDEQLAALKNENFSNSNYQIVKFKEMIQMLLYNNAAFLTTDNDLKIYADSQEKFDDQYRTCVMLLIIFIFSTILFKMMN